MTTTSTENKDPFASHSGDTYTIAYSDAAEVQGLIRAMVEAQSQLMDLAEQYYDADLNRNVLTFKEKS